MVVEAVGRLSCCVACRLVVRMSKYVTCCVSASSTFAQSIVAPCMAIGSLSTMVLNVNGDSPPDVSTNAHTHTPTCRDRPVAHRRVAHATLQRTGVQSGIVGGALLARRGLKVSTTRPTARTPIIYG